MSSRLSSVAIVLGAVLMHRAAGAAELTICIDEANPTAAMDLRVAQAAAETQGYTVKSVTFEGRGKGDDGLPISRFAKMATSDCQLIMGFPVDVGNPNLPPKVESTSAYAGTGFVMVRRAGSPNIALEALPKGTEVGIAQLDTYAGVLFSTHPNIVMHVYPQDSLMLADLIAKHISAGFAWQPAIAAAQARPRSLVQVAPLPGQHMSWNLVALYAPQSVDAANAFDKGLYELQSKGKLEPLIKPFRSADPMTQRNASNLSQPRLMPALAWEASSVGQLVRVADTAKPAPKASKTKNSKAPAIYTADQATKGQLAYYQNCAMCHGPNLDGQLGGYSGPALKGADFADPSYDFHVSDIFNFVSKLMPAATPGSLSHDEDVQIMSFILKQNGYPAGDKELVYEEAEKSKVAIRYYGK
jgi:polar amino acid transport system substrate-binding protein